MEAPSILAFRSDWPFEQRLAVSLPHPSLISKAGSGHLAVSQPLEVVWIPRARTGHHPSCWQHNIKHTQTQTELSPLKTTHSGHTPYFSTLECGHQTSSEPPWSHFSIVGFLTNTNSDILVCLTIILKVEIKIYRYIPLYWNVKWKWTNTPPYVLQYNIQSWIENLSISRLMCYNIIFKIELEIYQYPAHRSRIGFPPHGTGTGQVIGSWTGFMFWPAGDGEISQHTYPIEEKSANTYPIEEESVNINVLRLNHSQQHRLRIV